jgi:hypothetical protein
MGISAVSRYRKLASRPDSCFIGDSHTVFGAC